MYPYCFVSEPMAWVVFSRCVASTEAIVGAGAAIPAAAVRMQAAATRVPQQQAHTG